MIALLSYSTSWCQSNIITSSSTGEITVSRDSVLIAFDDLRKVNTKMVELKYEKEINDSLHSIIKNDDIIIQEYSSNVNALKKQVKQVKIQRNFAVSGGLLVTLFLAVIVIFK